MLFWNKRNKNKVQEKDVQYAKIFWAVAIFVVFILILLAI